MTIREFVYVRQGPPSHVGARDAPRQYVYPNNLSLWKAQLSVAKVRSGILLGDFPAYYTGQVPASLGRGTPDAMVVLVPNKPAWSTVNQWAPYVNTGIFQLIPNSCSNEALYVTHSDMLYEMSRLGFLKWF